MSLRVQLAMGALTCFATVLTHATPFAELKMPEVQIQAYELSDHARLGSSDLEALKGEVERLSAVTEGHFDGKPTGLFDRKITLYYRAFANPAEDKGGVIVVSGRTEGLALYYETIGDLLRNGYSVYMHDHRGQGYSSRILDDPKDESRGYVDDFANYVDDLQSFLSIVQSSRKDSNKPLFMIAHSMGGAVASLLLERKNAAIKAVALITPMFEPWASGDQQGLLEKNADRYCDSWAAKLPLASPFLSTRYVDGGDFDDMRKEFDLQPSATSSQITHDRTRLALNWNARASRCAGTHCGNGTAKVGGATFRWFNQACAASREARGPAAAQIEIPVLLLQGAEDTVVNPEKQVEFCDRLNASAPGHCIGLVVPGGRHGLLLEEDAYRQLTLAKTLSFFQCAADGSKGC